MYKYISKITNKAIVIKQKHNLSKCINKLKRTTVLEKLSQLNTIFLETEELKTIGV